MKISNRTKFKFFILLIALNVILRYPVIHHEIGWDSFEMHLLANSLSEFGEARWWAHPLSIIGMYPNSYASAVPFLLSGISLCMGLDVELVIFIYGLIFGLFSIFAGYILAGLIYNNDFFKFIVAYGFSISPGVLTYTTFTAPSRSLFILIMVLFVYSLLQCHTSFLRYAVLTSFLSIFLLSTHHMAYFLVPIFIGYAIVVTSHRYKKLFNFIETHEHFVTCATIVSFFLMFVIPFFAGLFKVAASKWVNLAVMSTEYPRYIGPLLIFSVGGLVYLLFKPHKRFEEWFLLIILLFLIPFTHGEMYMKWFIIIFAILLAGIGLLNIVKSYEHKNKCAAIIIVVFLLLSVFMGSFYQYYRTQEQSIHLYERYLDDNVYTSSIWIKTNINKAIISNERLTGLRIFSISGMPLFTGSNMVDQAYGFVDIRDDAHKTTVSGSADVTAMLMQFIRNPSNTKVGTEPDEYWERIMHNEPDRGTAPGFISKFTLTYVVENTKTQGKCYSHHGFRYSEFLHFIYEKKNCIYDSGYINIWILV